VKIEQGTFSSSLRREHSYFEPVSSGANQWRFHALMERALTERWHSTSDLRREGAGIVRQLLKYYAEHLQKPDPEWGAYEAEMWRRGMAIVVAQGPEQGLLNLTEWQQLLQTAP
jgi:hypothetical protein